MTSSSSIRIVISALALLFAANAAAVAQVPPVGPSGPTGWCTDKDGNNFRC